MIKLQCIKLYNSLGNMQRFTFLSYYVSMRLEYTILFPQPRKCRLTDMHILCYTFILIFVCLKLIFEMI